MREDATGSSTGSNVSSKSSAEGLKRETKPSPGAMPARRAVPAATSDGGWHHHNDRSPRPDPAPARTAEDVVRVAFLIVTAIVYNFVGKLILLIAGFILFVRGARRQEKALGLATEGER